MPTTRSRSRWPPRAPLGAGNWNPLRRFAQSGHAGVTLLELIVVMTILSVLFGIGIGAFRKLARPEQLATARIKEALRAAVLFAKSEGAPATVSVLPEENAVAAFGLRSVGNWHFEDDAGTGWPLAAVHDPDSLVWDGALGQALRLGSGSPLSLPNPPPSFDSPYGFGLDVFVRPRASPRPLTVLERAGLWRLALDGSDNLQVTLQLLGESGPEEIRHDVPGGRLPSTRFSRVTVVFDGRALTVSVDGARLGQDLLFPTARRLAQNPGVAITSGRAPNGFQGDLDELRLLSVVGTDRADLPQEVELLGAARLLRFDGSGHLDPAWHRTPVQVRFRYGEPLQEASVEVGLLGTVSSQEGLRPGTSAHPESEGGR